MKVETASEMLMAMSQADKILMKKKFQFPTKGKLNDINVSVIDKLVLNTSLQFIKLSNYF